MATLQISLSATVCRDARTFLGLTQEEFAAAAETSVSTVRRCERGEKISDYASKQILAALEAQGVTFIAGRLKDQACWTRNPG